jgi:hypothetical protein
MPPLFQKKKLLQKKICNSRKKEEEEKSDLSKKHKNENLFLHSFCLMK